MFSLLPVSLWCCASTAAFYTSSSRFKYNRLLFFFINSVEFLDFQKLHVTVLKNNLNLNLKKLKFPTTITATVIFNIPGAAHKM